MQEHHDGDDDDENNNQGSGFLEAVMRRFWPQPAPAVTKNHQIQKLARQMALQSLIRAAADETTISTLEYTEATEAALEELGEAFRREVAGIRERGTAGLFKEEFYSIVADNDADNRAEFFADESFHDHKNIRCVERGCVHCLRYYSSDVLYKLKLFYQGWQENIRLHGDDGTNPHEAWEKSVVSGTDAPKFDLFRSYSIHYDALDAATGVQISAHNIQQRSQRAARLVLRVFRDGGFFLESRGGRYVTMSNWDDIIGLADRQVRESEDFWTALNMVEAANIETLRSLVSSLKGSVEEFDDFLEKEEALRQSEDQIRAIIAQDTDETVRANQHFIMSRLKSIRRNVIDTRQDQLRMSRQIDRIEQGHQHMLSALGRLDAQLVSPVPRLFIVIPVKPKSGLHPRSRLRSLFQTKFYFYFVCAHSSKVTPHIKLYANRDWLVKIAPALCFSLTVLQVAGRVVTGVDLKLGDVATYLLELGVDRLEMSSEAATNAIELTTEKLEEIANNLQDFCYEIHSNDDRDFLTRVRSGREEGVPGAALTESDVKRLKGEMYHYIRNKVWKKRREWTSWMTPVRRRGQAETLWIMNEYTHESEYEMLN